MTRMKKVYICSKYRGDVERNVEKARRYCRFALDKGFLPIAPHLYFTQFLDDSKDEERAKGIEAGVQLLLECSELWLFMDDGEPSVGMSYEIAMAKNNGIPIVRCLLSE